MKFRVFLIVLGLAGVAAVAALLFYPPAKPAYAPLTPAQRARALERARRFEPAPAALVYAAPPVTPPPQPIRIPPPEPIVPTRLEVPIQDKATIDFSIGAPVVRSGGADTEAMDRALRQMEEATRNIKFPPAEKK